jgi:asparagine synthetase B (glutamine-hydrolysing)
VRESAKNRATPALREWLEEHILKGSEPGANHAIRNLALHQGLSEYHLTSVDRSGMAFGLEIRPPYLDNALVEYAAGLEEASLIDRTEYWTKIPLRSIAKRRFTEPDTKRIAVRRKRAMPAAVEIAATRLMEKLPDQKSDQTKPELFQALLTKLFYYLHVDPGVSSPPDFSIFEFAAEFS